MKAPQDQVQQQFVSKFDYLDAIRRFIDYMNFSIYYKRFDELLPENNHLNLIVVFRTRLDEHGEYVSNNFVVTGWANYIRPKG